MIRLFHVYYPTRIIVLLLCESLIVCTSFMLATAIVTGPDAYVLLNYDDGALKIAGITALTILCSYYFDLYQPQSIAARWEIYFRILLVLGLVSIILSGIIYIFPDIAIARYVLPLGLVLLAVALVAWRRAYEWLLGQPIFRERVFVLGEGAFAHDILRVLEGRTDTGMKVVGWGPEWPRPAESSDASPATHGPLQRFRPPVDRVIVALDDRRQKLPVRELLRLRFEGVAIEEAGTLLERLSGKLQLEHLRPSSFIYPDGFRLKTMQQIPRRVASTLAAVLGLILFAPFFPVVALLVRLSSPGPIFFRQTRVGFRGRHFKVVKFRTMAQNAESATGAKWAVKNDPRVTPVGRFMRKCRIDEVPQLWNVLCGDMGFVGPRPERPEFVPILSNEMPYYHLRHMIRPGLTGWAQVRYGYGGSLEESRHKLEFDLYYLKHMSLGLDLLIMFETIKTIIRRRGGQ
jgi:sugar transferase (PEP-CTERM system associated)